MKRSACSSTYRWFGWCALALMLAIGCGQETGALVSVDSEKEANLILVKLQDAGIQATKTPVTARRKTIWEIAVADPKEDLDRARRWLVRLDLPHDKPAGFDAMLESSGLIPTKTDERARLMYAIAGELTRTFEAIDRVIQARVHINLPDQSMALAGTQPSPEPSATVLIKYETVTLADDEPGTPAGTVASSPPIHATEVQEMVARSVEGLCADNVKVHFTRADLPRGPVKAVEGMSPTVGPGTETAPAEANVVKKLASKDRIVHVLLGGNVVFGLLVVFLAVRLRSALQSSGG